MMTAGNNSSTFSNDRSTAAVLTTSESSAALSTLPSPSAPLPSSAPLSSPSSTSLLPTASPSSAEQPSPVPRHPNVGAIAGGTVVGFVALASLGLIAFLWLSRRRRRKIAPSAAYRAAYGSTPPPIYPRVQSIPPGHHTPPSRASENFVVSSTRNTIFDGHRPSVAF